MTLDQLTELAARVTDTSIPIYAFTLDELAALAEAIAAEEREACAKFLESGVDLKGLAGDPQMQAFCGHLLIGCAAAIRARGQA